MQSDGYIREYFALESDFCCTSNIARPLSMLTLNSIWLAHIERKNIWPKTGPEKHLADEWR
jgi:hypothetical protein